MRQFFSTFGRSEALRSIESDRCRQLEAQESGLAEQAPPVEEMMDVEEDSFEVIERLHGTASISYCGLAESFAIKHFQSPVLHANS